MSRALRTSSWLSLKTAAGSSPPPAAGARPVASWQREQHTNTLTARQRDVRCLLYPAASPMHYYETLI